MSLVAARVRPSVEAVDGPEVSGEGDAGVTAQSATHVVVRTLRTLRAVELRQREAAAKASRAAVETDAATCEGAIEEVCVEQKTGGGEDAASRAPARCEDTIEEKRFALHAVISDDEALWARCCLPLAEAALAGGRATLIAYGASGSGKTYSARGAQLRAARHLLEQLQATGSSGSSVEVSFFENAGDRCYDLLDDRKALQLRTDASGDVVVVGLSKRAVSSSAEFESALAAANELRATAPTEKNPLSSRSHAICELSIATTGAATTDAATTEAATNAGGRLRVVDLAGSEQLRAGAAGHSLERLREAREINASLSCLNECIRATLCNANRAPGAAPQHVPFRRAKLTMLLGECFAATDGEESKTVSVAFVAHVGPSSAAAAESRKTLEFALALLETSRLETEKKAVTQGSPEQWSAAKCEKWAQQLDDGAHANVASAFRKSGKTLATIYRGDLVRQVEALGGDEAEAERLYDAFKHLCKKAKAGAARKAPPRAGGGLAERMAQDRALLRKNRAGATADDRCGTAANELEALHDTAAQANPADLANDL